MEKKENFIKRISESTDKLTTVCGVAKNLDIKYSINQDNILISVDMFFDEKKGFFNSDTHYFSYYILEGEEEINMLSKLYDYFSLSKKINVITLEKEKEKEKKIIECYGRFK